MKILGMEIVAVYWVVEKTSFAIDVDKVDDLSREELPKIGKGKPTDEKLSYITMMECHTRDTQRNNPNSHWHGQ
eukprot:3611160-Ditylum_brightwellii.AAC.1